MYLNRGLIIRRGREYLRTRGRDSGVAFDEFRRDAPHCFNTKRERYDIEEQYVFHVSSHNAALDSRAQRHDFVWIDAHVRLLAEELLYRFLQSWHTCLTANEHHLINVRHFERRGLHRSFRYYHRPIDEFSGKFFELCPRQLDKEVLRSCIGRGDERNINFSLDCGGEFDLRLFGCFIETLTRERVIPYIDAALFPEFIGKPGDDLLVDVFAAE